MKISVDDLKKVMKWIEAFSSDSFIRTSIDVHDKIMYITLTDKYQSKVTIKLFESGGMLPKINKEDILG